MSVRSFINLAQRYAIDNSPTLLTAFGVTGTLATAYLTGKATFKAADILRREAEARVLMEKQPPPPTKKQQVGMVWKCYIPPAISVVTTVGCIVAANTISMSRAAAMAAAYTLADKNFGEYKEKVKEIIGEKKEGEIRTALAQDAVNNTPMINVERGHGGDTLCLDKWTGRFFTSDMQTIRAAENDLNKGLYKGSERVATLGDFYQCLGLSSPKCSEDVGWNADSSLDLTFDTVLREGQPVLVMDFANTPFPIHGVFGTA
jgi:hypothetical protein